MIKALTTRIMARIKNLAGTGTITGAQTSIVQIKTATGRTNDRIKRVHNYGFMSRPLVDAKAYTLFIGGATSRGITIHVEDERHQIELAEGEVAMLDDKGNLIHFTQSGIKLHASAALEVTAAKDITINTPATITENGKTIHLNGGTGAITCQSTCPFTGKPHVDGSQTVFVGK